MSEYIDKNKLLKAVEREIAETEQDGANKMLIWGAIGVKNIIAKFPTENVEITERGEWLKDKDSGVIACSVCHTISLHGRSRYCPNCGANLILII